MTSNVHTDITGKELKLGDYVVYRVTSWYGLKIGRYLHDTPGGSPSFVHSKTGTKKWARGDFLIVDPRTLPPQLCRELDEGFEKACKKYRIKIGTPANPWS